MGEKRDWTALSSDVLEHSVSRRTLLARTALFGITVPAAFSLLAACGGDDDDDDDTPAATEPGGSTGSSTPAGDAGEGDATEEADAGEDAGDSGSEGGEPEGELVIMQGVDANTLDPMMNCHVRIGVRRMGSSVPDVCPSRTARDGPVRPENSASVNARPARMKEAKSCEELNSLTRVMIESPANATPTTTTVTVMIWNSAANR